VAFNSYRSLGGSFGYDANDFTKDYQLQSDSFDWPVYRYFDPSPRRQNAIGNE
jgi:hypothetical protein